MLKLYSRSSSDTSQLFRDLLGEWSEGPYQRHMHRLTPESETLELNRKPVRIQVPALNYPVVIETSAGPLRDWSKRADFDGTSEYFAWDQPRRYGAWRKSYGVSSQFLSPAVYLIRHRPLYVPCAFFSPVTQALAEFQSCAGGASEYLRPVAVILNTEHVAGSLCSHTRGRPSNTSPLDSVGLRPVDAPSSHLLRGHVLERCQANPYSHRFVRLSAHPLSLQSAATRRPVACGAGSPRLSPGVRQLHIHSIDVLPVTVRQTFHRARGNQLHRVRRRTHSRRTPVGVITNAPVPSDPT